VTTPVRLFPDFGARPPLWTDAGLFADAPLSPPLRKRLDRWADVWEAECHPATGWADEDRRTAWVEEGNALAEAASEELGSLGFSVVADFAEEAG